MKAALIRGRVVEELIHPADPLSWPVIIIFAPKPSVNVGLFPNLATTDYIYKEIILATVVTVVLADGILDPLDLF